MTMKPKRAESMPAVHTCPVCRHPQTKVQRRLGGLARGSVIYICARADECVLGVDLTKVDTWAPV